MGAVSSCEILVVGGGLAGATAARRLAAAGREVVLLEKESGPHDKVCGEFLSPESVPLLRSAGVDVDALGASFIDGFALAAGRARLRIPLNGNSFPEADGGVRARGLSRRVLDEACLEAARTTGALIVRGVTATGKRKEAAGFVIQTTVGEWRARNVFWATGKHELKSVQPRRGWEGGSIGFKRHVRLAAAARGILGGDVALHAYRGGYAGLCAIEGGRASFCFILDRDGYRAMGSTWEGCLEALKRLNPHLRDLLRDAEFSGPRPLTVAPLPYGHLRRGKSADSGSFYLGDQFAVIPSFSGTGMAIALITASLAAAHFLRGGSAAAYEREAARLVARRMRFARPLHLMLRSQALAAVCVRALAPFPGIVRKFVEGTRFPAV